MRARLIAGLVVASLLASVAAGAAVVPLPQLPEFEMSRAPLQPPASVASGGQIPGLFVSGQPAPSPKFRHVRLFRSASEASAFWKKGGMPQDDPKAPRPCAYVAQDSSTLGQPWSSLATDSIGHFMGSGQPAVVGLHVETLEGDWTAERGGALGIIDGWLDVRSRGLRVIERKKMPVKQVAEGPFGIRVFAARGKDTVHFVVLPPPMDAGIEPGTFTSFERAVIQNSGEVGTTECRHVRVSLAASRGAGAQASVSFQHLQPIPADAVEDGAGSSATLDMMTFRLLRVHLSASRNATSDTPIVSVSFHAEEPQLIQ